MLLEFSRKHVAELLGKAQQYHLLPSLLTHPCLVYSSTEFLQQLPQMILKLEPLKNRMIAALGRFSPESHLYSKFSQAFLYHCW